VSKKPMRKKSVLEKYARKLVELSRMAQSRHEREGATIGAQAVRHADELFFAMNEMLLVHESRLNELEAGVDPSPRRRRRSA